MPALRLRRGGCARRLLAQPLLEVLLEPAAQRDHLRVPLELIGDVVEAAVVQLVQAPQGELDVAGILGGGRKGMRSSSPTCSRTTPPPPPSPRTRLTRPQASQNMA